MMDTDTEFAIYVCYRIKKSDTYAKIIPFVYKTKMDSGKAVTSLYQSPGIVNTNILAYEKYTVKRSSSQITTAMVQNGNSVNPGTGLNYGNTAKV